MRGRVWLTRCIAGAVLFAGPFTAIAQAPLAGALPGRTVELHGLHQPVSNGYGDWSGAYARVIVPGARNTLFLDALGVRGFGERGVQGGVAHRLAWSDNVGTTLTRFASQELALAWRERIGTSRALNVQFDRYSNPYYTRMGVTLGVAQYW